jgi:hypothetical protein
MGCVNTISEPMGSGRLWLLEEIMTLYFWNSLLMNIVGPKRQEVTGGERKLNVVLLFNTYC